MAESIIPLNTKHIEAGSATVTRNPGNNTVTISFSREFSAIPYVGVSLATGSPEAYTPFVSNVTNTGALIGLRNSTSSSASNTVLKWCAIQI